MSQLTLAGTVGSRHMKYRNYDNDDFRELELHLTYSPISLFKWQMYMSQKMRSQWGQYLGDSKEHSDDEEDMLKVGDS